MKLRSLLLTALLGLGTLAPLNFAKADHESTRVTYDSRGCPTYWALHVGGYDCHGRPIYNWVRTNPPAPRYDYDDYRPRYSSSYHSYDDDRPRYSSSYHNHDDDRCHSGSRSGFFFHFGR